MHKAKLGKAGMRWLLIFVSIGLWSASFTPYSLPLIFFSLSPLFVLWRCSAFDCSIRTCICEAGFAGALLCWSIIGFVGPAVPSWGWILQAVASICYCPQVMAIAIAIRLTRGLSQLQSALIVSLVSVAMDFVQAQVGLIWSTTNPSLAIASTASAQWSGILSPSGLIYLVYFVNYACAPTKLEFWKANRCSIIFGLMVLCILQIGGTQISRSIVVQPLKFSTMIVQPHLFQADKNEAWQPWGTLDELTRLSLEKDGLVDLIIWPESSLSESRYGRVVQKGDAIDELQEAMQVQHLAHRYGTNCLAGVTMLDNVIAEKYGVQMSTVVRYNCGCIVTKSGSIDCHEKLALVPLKEGLPPILNWSWTRERLLPFFGMTAPYTVGRQFHLLSFRSENGNEVKVAVVVCYESWLPWLPQFNDQNDSDAICYLLYDGDFVHNPELIQRQILGIRLRSIESRRWSIVCSTWQGSTVINPRGEVVAQLDSVPGVIRTDLN